MGEILAQKEKLKSKPSKNVGVRASLCITTSRSRRPSRIILQVATSIVTKCTSTSTPMERQMMVVHKSARHRLAYQRKNVGFGCPQVALILWERPPHRRSGSSVPEATTRARAQVCW